MLGFGSYDSNKLSKKRTTLVHDMRRASKNILYTVANSGYYASDAKVDTVNHMDELFVQINLRLLAGFAVAEIALLLVKALTGRKRRKRKES